MEDSIEKPIPGKTSTRHTLTCYGQLRIAFWVAIVTLTFVGCGTTSTGPVPESAESGPGPDLKEPTPQSTSPISETPDVDVESLFTSVQDYRFRDFPLPSALRLRLEESFAPLAPIEVTAKRTESLAGDPIPVRILAIRFTSPKGISLEQIAYEIGRDFLGATPQNSSEALNGRGIYMSPKTEGGSETLTFFISREIFVYVFGAEVVPGPVEFEVAALRLAAATWW